MMNLNRIERGATVRATDGDFGSVYQVIVDPDTKELTHVVVSPSGGGDTLMVPVSMISDADGTTVTLSGSRSELGGRTDLRYNEDDFQPVDPDSVERPGATPEHGGQPIVEADSNTVEFGGGGTTFATGGTSTAGDTTYTDADAPATTSFTTPDDRTATTVSTSDTSPAPSPAEPGERRKGRDLLGLPVLSFADGERLGKVEDVLFDPEQNQVVALLTAAGGWLSSAEVVPWQNIRTIGHDSVIVHDRSSEIKADSDPYIKRIMEADNILTNTQVYTEDGRDLGKIGDLYLDDGTGEVVGYEVSGGMFATTLRGKKFMPAPGTLTVGRDAAFVPDSVGDEMEAQVGGLTGATQQATSATGDALSGARDRVATATADQQRQYVVGKTVNNDVTADDGSIIVPAGKVVDESDVQKAESAGKLNALVMGAGGAAAGGLFGQLREQASGLTDRIGAAAGQQRGQQLDSAIGKVSANDVFADDGTTIALQGSVVDTATVERARAYGKENQLLGAVGTAVVQQQAQQATQSAREGLERAGEGIQGAFAGLRERFDDMSQQQREGREEAQIKGALGLPVNRVILDRDDSIILETAQIVTNEAINRARTAGVLDILLSSVEKNPVALSPEAFHSGGTGEAALPPAYERERKPEDPIS